MKSLLEKLCKSKEDKEMLKDILKSIDAFHLIGERNSNGADSYTCPCCYESINIMGNSSFISHGISEVKHEDDCKLNNLHELLYEDMK